MNFYLNKYGFRPPFLTEKVTPNTGLIVVIPCFNEPDILPTLNALCSCDRPNVHVEIIVVINSGTHHPESIKRKNLETKQQIDNFSGTVNIEGFSLHTIFVDDLPKKHAGVGLARKIGMDEAVSRFHQIDSDGIIACFDADATCAQNYLTALVNHFEKHPLTPGCSVRYAHPLEGNEFEAQIYEGIINYELHLRYYNLCLGYAQLLYAYHTVGSSMAVRSSAYQKQGGMNKRKAGEDFYFIHKIIALGNFTTLNTTKVIPSPRISDRVPFGTGKAIGDWIESGTKTYTTYAFRSFELIRKFVELVPYLQTAPLQNYRAQFDDEDWKLLSDFLTNHQFEKSLIEIRKNSKTKETFQKRFFVWLDAFKILKFTHYLRDIGWGNASILEQTNLLLRQLNEKELATVKSQLLRLREIEG